MFQRGCLENLATEFINFYSAQKLGFAEQQIVIALIPKRFCKTLSSQR